MVKNDLPYLPSFSGFYDPPLGRFLPALPKGVISQWLEENTKPGDLVMDPLGANPLSAVEAARTSRRVLFARNNPILWLMLEAIASAPSDTALRGIVNKLLLSRHLDETLDRHLQSIYETTCNLCGKKLQPLGYVWEKDGELPVAKVYACPHCGDSGEKPVSEFDIQNLGRLGKISLHRTRASQRVMQGGDYEKESIETALDCYLPRAIYITMLLVNRLEGLELDKSERLLLQAILVSVFDDGTSLWHWPEKDRRQLQLSVPSHFIEKNLWISLNTAPEVWKQDGEVVPVSYWPNLPPIDGGICLYQRRLADQKSLLENEKPKALISIFPRPNQAFWTLSALWSGWLWGRKGAIAMRSALSRRRYDWDWFAQAIRASFQPLEPGLIQGTKIFGLFPQYTPNFYLGLQTGINMAGFNASGAASRSADDLIQCQWVLNSGSPLSENLNLRSLIEDFFNDRGEPANYLEIIMHCLTELSLLGKLPETSSVVSESLFSEIQNETTAILRDGQFLQSFNSGQTGGSQWWLCDPKQAQIPLSEQVEAAIRNILLKKDPVIKHNLEKQICSQYRGSLTPPAELIKLCLESYADPIVKAIHHYLLHPDEDLKKRNLDLIEMRSLISRCAEKLRINEKSNEGSIVWKTQGNLISYRFFIIDSCSISKIIQETLSDEGVNNVILFPGSRSRLLAYRLKHDPRLEAAAEQNWYFVKFRTFRRLAQQENLTLDLWKEILVSDPPLWDPPLQFQLL